MPSFKLSKWYLDSVSDQGDTSIAYTGTVRWGLVRINYSSLLETTGGRITVRNSLRRQREPEIQNGVLFWHAKSLKMDGEWRANSNALRDVIYTSQNGSIEWNCMMPQAHTRFRDRVGLGYAEHLTMTIAPWKLPIQTLLWGRFTSASDWITWLDWQGEFSRRLVYVNGCPVQPSLLDDDRIEFPDGARLSMDRSLVIRNGPLGSTALSGIPGIRKTFPARLLQINECKWRSHARLQKPDGSAVDGWAIHERVSWPK
ncbi:MAG TPA: hypothetical protein VI685_07505 [Candidatus Angelobacter sp.]